MPPLPIARRRASAPPELPVSPLPEVSPAAAREIEAIALEANERYLTELIEEHSFCPFARGGRAQGQTTRFIHYHDTAEVTPLLELMVRAASDPSKVVIQVIFPMLDITSEAWTRFCHELTAAGHDHLNDAGLTVDDVFAVAPLHPGLTYNTQNPFALVPLFRRAPDPTIQWVRLDGLKALYAGRSRDTVFVDIDNIEAFMQQKHRPPLLDRIAETNMKMAQRLGIDHIERALAEIARSARRRYINIFLEEGSKTKIPKENHAQGCPFSHHEDAKPALSTAPTILATRHDDAWSLIPERALEQRTPRHVLADDIDLVVVRIRDAVRVFYGRCPHRLALLSEAIVEDDRFVCPQHGWDFNLDTGASEGVFGEGVHRFRSWINDGQVWIKAAELEQWRADNPQSFTRDEIDP